MLKKTILVLFALCMPFAAHPNTQSKDFKRISQLFHRAEIAGAQLVKCGRELEQKKMFATIDYLELAYKKLNRDFPISSPSLVDQLQERFDAVCRAIDCRTIDKSYYAIACKKISPSGTSEELEQFDLAIADADKRLSKTKGVSAINARAESCPNSAQYYQDAYVANLKVSDLECFKKVLERQRRY